MKNLKNNHIKTILYIALFFTFSQFISAQNNQLDSLFNCLKKTSEDSVKAQLLLEIGNLFEKNSTDSAIYFYHQAIKHAENQLSDENCQMLNAQSYRNLGAVYLRYKGQNDSAIYFTEKALTIFSKLTNSKNKKLATTAKDETSSCYTNLGIIQKNQGSYAQAIEFYIKSLKIDKEIDNKKGMAADYNNIGNIQYYQKNFDEAIKYYSQSLKLREIIDDKEGMISCNVNIGNIYFKQQKYTLAQFFYQKALKLSNIIGNKRAVAQCSMNIATVIGKIGNYNLALDSFISSLKIYEELEDKYNICLNWCNIASMNLIIADSSNISKQEKLSCYNEAIKYGLKSYNLAKELKALSLVKYSADVLMDSYRGIYNPVKALEFAQISIAANDSMFLEEKTKAIAEMESKYQNEKKQKEIELLEKDKTLQTKEIAKQTLLRNSFIIGFLLIFTLAFIILISYRQKRKANKLLLLKNFEIEQKKEEIQSQANLLLETNNELEKLSVIARETDNSVIIADSSGHIEWVNEGFTKLFGYKLEEFIAQKGDNLRKATSNGNFETYFQSMISEKKSVNYLGNTLNKFGNEIWVQTNLWPILNQLGEISKIVIIETDITKIKNAEEKATELYNIAEYQKLQITDSINYAKIIQSSILPSISEIKKSFPEMFIIYKPKDVVSGDFYYYAELGDYKIFATVDCTGHGVPGAFMSMIGYDILNHIIFVQGIVRPAEILTRLHKGIRFAFSKEKNIVNNGMDLSICSINPDKKELLYAGAFNEIYIVNEKNNSTVLNLCNKSIENDKFILSELLSDKISIGGDNEDVKFTEKRLAFSENDSIYMFSDGFVDQFGGKKKRKYMSKRLKDFLLNIQDIDMESQGFAVNNEFESWKGNEEQTDDVLLIGIKFTSKDESFKLELSAGDFTLLQPFLIELQNINIYNTGKVLNILKSIVNESETIKKWKEAVEKAIYDFDEAEYKRLIEIENKNMII